MDRNRRGSPGPAGLAFFAIFFVLFILPTLARTGGVVSLFVLVLIGWLGVQVIRIAMRAGREADHVAAPTRRLPDDVLVHEGLPEPTAGASLPSAPQVTPSSSQVPQPEPKPDASAGDDPGYAVLEARLADLAGQRDRGEITAEEYERRRADAIRTF